MPPYDELVLVANEDALERDGGRIRAFLGALARGTRDLRADPETGDQAAARGRTRASTRAPARGAKVTLPLFSAPRGQALRLAGPRRVERVRGLDAREQAAAQHHGRARSSYDNELLPASGL